MEVETIYAAYNQRTKWKAVELNTTTIKSYNYKGIFVMLSYVLIFYLSI